MSVKATVRAFLPRDLVNHRILAGPLRGMRIVTSWHDYPSAILGRTERGLLAWLADNVSRGETWLDVGAHYGYTAIALSRLVSAAGRVFAFEPMVSTAGCLCQTKELNSLEQLEILPLGLAAPIDLQVRRLPSTRGMADATRPSERHESLVLLVRLDDLWPKICRERDEIHGVKLDVQGMELEVLEGMRHLLSRWHPKLVVEVHKAVRRDTLVELLASVGYISKGMPLQDQSPGDQYLDDRSYVFA